MNIRAIPLIIIPFILYNIVALLWKGTAADDVFREVLFTVPLPGARRWAFSKGDLIMFITMVALFFELIKSTWTGTASLLDHGLSMLVFIACLIEFILVERAATSVFFFVMLAALIDVVAGYTISIRSARRDLNIGADT